MTEATPSNPSGVRPLGRAVLVEYYEPERRGTVIYVPESVRKGETLGIVGNNGSGKSTLLQIICGTLSPSFGEVEVNGRVAALLELGAGFNPELTGRENVFMNASILGLQRDEIDLGYRLIVAEYSQNTDQ